MSQRSFLSVPTSAWTAQNALAFAIRDQHPVSPGHSLVIPRRLVATWFDATPDEQRAILALVDEVKAALDRELAPDGYNVGFNAGEAAGQTVMHLHVHVIPRFRGDMDDPRGGVRHVIPSKGNPLRVIQSLATGGTDDPFCQHVLPLFALASEVAIVAAFVQESGVVRIMPALRDALARGARVRLVTGDYLSITQASALEMLLDLERSSMVRDEDDEAGGSFEARVVETERLPGRSRSFHPKAWRFEAATFGIAFVGSSNLSLSALDTGIEWNLRVDRDRDAQAYARVRDAFEALYQIGRPLDAAWIDAYAERARKVGLSLPPGEIEPEPLRPPEAPHRLQSDALLALRKSRAEGRARALVVLATGLGKTWLSAFDYAQLADELGVRPRLLFLAHRRELLRQAAVTYRRLLRARGEHARIGWCVEEHSELDRDLVFASVAKLARPELIERVRAQRFDYVVVDEVHHAAAESYRRILAALEPRFLLGLTATPDRADAADVLGLFDDHLAYRADIPAGVDVGRLVPFHYFGLKDEIDYANIPWRNRRWDPELLAQSAQTERRMQTLWEGWQAHPATRTLVFCCSIAHARYVRAWLGARGVRVAAVFAGEGSDDRDTVLADLGAGELDALCAVDVFNEGVDLPALDRVVMLRPTESSVVFLQQLGRGLRAHASKRALTVIDFVGNHRVFLERLRTLLSLGGNEAAGRLARFLTSPDAVDLPAGCSVEVALEAKELLGKLFRTGGADSVERAYRELRAARGARPSAGELERMGYRPGVLAVRHGSWFEFVRGEGDLDEAKRNALDLALPFLRELETTGLPKSYKLVALEAMLEAELLTQGMPLRELALRAHATLRRSPELWNDVADPDRFAMLDAQNETAWLDHWRQHAIAAWTTAKKNQRPWLRLREDRLELNFSLPATDAEAFASLTRELVDYRLAQYRRRAQPAAGEGFVCALTWNQRDPILKLPGRNAQPLPEGETDVRLPDGSLWQFRFMKEFINVARPPGAPKNQLPDLLRGWFGPRAGQPGTAFRVRFYRSPDGLWIEPIRAAVTALEPRRGVIAYPDLRAAAGHAQGATDELEAARVFLPVEDDDPNLFAVRVAGSSMDGGAAPLRDGDWALMQLARGAPADALLNRVVLVQVPAQSAGVQYQIKRLAKEAGRWVLASDNPDGPRIEPGEQATVIARLRRGIQPEELAPSVGTMLREDELSAAFGLEALEAASGRQGGHLFLFIDRAGMLEAPDRVRFAVERRRPSETAFVLAKLGDRYRYLGVGRWREDTATWNVPEVDFATWRAWGTGKEVSRAVPDGYFLRAQAAVDAFLALPERERVVQQSEERRARVLGRAQRGGLRIDGGDGGFGERTLSLADIAWVAVAQDDVSAHGGLLDEQRVNRLRYLEGTPKGSTRWIDTTWALAFWAKARPLVPNVEASPLAKLRRDDGTQLEASFRVHKIGSQVSVIVEARGGTVGSASARNTQYAEGLALLLHRLKAQNLRVADALVESRETADLPAEVRRIRGPNLQYPLAIGDPHQLARELQGAQASVGRAPGARGSGNRTRRIRIVVEGLPAAWTAAQAATAFSAGELHPSGALNS